jgi:hypothetical protein
MKRWRTWLSPAARKGRDRARQREEISQRVAELTGQKLKHKA